MSQAATTPPAHPKARSSWALLVGYILLVLSLTGLDQVTKIHAERDLMSYSDRTDLRLFGSDRHHVFTWGVSPASARMNAMDPKSQTTSNWVDFHLTYVRNTGAAWGALSDLPKMVRVPLFFAATLIAIGVVAHLFRQSHPGQRLFRTTLCFILAGALGNFIDRVWLGYVIDFIQFQWHILGWQYSFPVFNVADVAINVGVGLFLIDMILAERDQRRAKRLAKTTEAVHA